MVWMGRAGRHASWEQVEADGPTYEELASPDTTAMLKSLNQEAAEAEAPTDGAGPSQIAQKGEPRQPPVISRAAQTESAAEEGTFLLEPLLQNAMAVAVHDLLGGVDVEVPWLNLVSLADELVDHLYEKLEELREGVMDRPLRMVGPEREVTGGNTEFDGTPQQPPPPAGPGGGPQPAPREEEGPPRRSATAGSAGRATGRGKPTGDSRRSTGGRGPTGSVRGATGRAAGTTSRGGPTGGARGATGAVNRPDRRATGDVRHVRGDAGRVPRRGRGCDAPV
jgi:hypothetical protein